MCMKALNCNLLLISNNVDEFVIANLLNNDAAMLNSDLNMLDLDVNTIISAACMFDVDVNKIIGDAYMLARP